MGSDELSWAVGLQDENATTRFATKLAPVLKAGDVVALSGQLGAGKTSLARGIIRAIAGTNIDVPSPTFSLAQEYRELAPPVVHYDLYRLRGAGELAELGFGEVDRDAIALVEWPERAEGMMPPQTLSIDLVGRRGGRLATITGGAVWSGRLRGLRP
ncbi:MAG: tRNA (adenosine(37)-N6)-threonylcarbamoyltransferase complex ATPase subunit type 1 TsaE [Alphaproteobacteria bacterium]